MPTLTAATRRLTGEAAIRPERASHANASLTATHAPVIAAVRVPPSACNTSQSTLIVCSPKAKPSSIARNASADQPLDLVGATTDQCRPALARMTASASLAAASRTPPSATPHPTRDASRARHPPRSPHTILAYSRTTPDRSLPHTPLPRARDALVAARRRRDPRARRWPSVPQTPRIRSTIPVVECPGVSGTTTTSPPRARTSGAPTIVASV